ncbi:MAG: hypothetical protein WCB31_05960 [Nitrososphaeraceae archaeon]
MNTIERKFKENLNHLYEKNKLTLEQLEHFLKRGIQVIDTQEDLKLKFLSSILPKIVIGASKEYISRLKIPYQATSFLAAEFAPESRRYIYKVPGYPGGGVIKLTGNKRNLGDNVFASTHRILIGYRAILFSINTLMASKSQIWDWTFFGNHIKSSHSGVYDDLCKLYQQYKQKRDSSYFIIVSRTANSFKKSGIIESYLKKEIAILNKDIRKVIFLTSQEGYDYGSKYIPESDFIKYINTGSTFNLFKALLSLRKDHKIDLILNDGGRIMCNGFKIAGVLGEERITLEPYPGKTLIDPHNCEMVEECTLGIGGSGIDGSVLRDSILLHSSPIGDERANTYVYPLDDSKLLSF